MLVMFFFSSRRRHTRWPRDWSSDVCSSDLLQINERVLAERRQHVVIEGNRGRNIGFTRPIEIKLDRDGRLGCGPLNLGGSLLCHASNTSTRARLNALIDRKSVV